MRLHHSQKLFEFFLTRFISEDKKIAIFTSQVFKDISLHYPDFVENVYIPRLLNLTATEAMEGNVGYGQFGVMESVKK